MLRLFRAPMMGALSLWLLVGCASTTAPPAASPPPAPTHKEIQALVPGQVVHAMRLSLTGKDQNVAFVSERPFKSPVMKTRQYFLTILGWTGSTWQVVFRSPGPGPGGDLILEQTRTASWENSLSLAGAADLSGSGQEDLLVHYWATGADCGSANIYILGERSGRISLLAQVTNPCDLHAEIRGHEITLVGPRYLSTDALCCPSDPNARATLSYDRQKAVWVESPQNYPLRQP